MKKIQNPNITKSKENPKPQIPKKLKVKVRMPAWVRVIVKVDHQYLTLTP